jgi:pyruvate/2-oxoacid:ferredoxin oxidoreductase beta subunit
MEEIKIKIPEPKRECRLISGHTACPGCGLPLILKYIFEVVGTNAVAVVPACCLTVVSGNGFQTCFPIPLKHTAFETAAVTAEMIKIGLKIKGNHDATVVAIAGDGGTFDIGLQSLSGAAERGAKIIYVCYDNEAYMNTGIQRSGATPYGAITTTTPGGCLLWKKNMPKIVAAHRVPYVAVVSIAWPDDLKKKILRAKTQGFAYVQAFSPCQAGQKFSSDLSIDVAEMAVRTGVYPVYEIISGKIIAETMIPKPEAKLEPVENYLKLQGRFRHLKEVDIKEIQKRIIEERIALLKKAGLKPPDFDYLL